MAYCKRCGAYIPDGLSACLACGYDDAAEKQNSGEQAAAQSQQRAGRKKNAQFDNDFLRRELDEQRRRQQENSRKWAETEYAQRQKAKQEQEQQFKRSSAAPNASTIYRGMRNAAGTDDTGKVLAGLSYFSFLFVLPYIFRSEDSFATFHAKQGLNLFVAGIIADVVGGIFHVGWLVTLARLYLIYKGVSNVVNNKKEPLPYIGKLIR